jgi:hypothetical protein
MSSIRSLSGCPMVVAQTLTYLADDIIVHCNIPHYLTLRYAINAVWAKEVRRSMEICLQRTQTALALANYRLVYTYKTFHRNPIYCAMMEVTDLALIFDCALNLQEFTIIARLLLAYARKVKETPPVVSRPVYITLDGSYVVRGRASIGIYISDNHEDSLDDLFGRRCCLLKDVEVSVSSMRFEDEDAPQTYDLAFALSDGEEDIDILLIKEEGKARWLKKRGGRLEDTEVIS